MNESNDAVDACNSGQVEDEPNSTRIEEQLHEERRKRLLAESEAALLREKVSELEEKLATAEPFSRSTSPRRINSVDAPRKGSALSSPRNEKEVSDSTALKNENEKLRSYVKRQSALIDVLRRQKILLEASTALALTSKDFAKDLELEK